MRFNVVVSLLREQHSGPSYRLHRVRDFLKYHRNLIEDDADEEIGLVVNGPILQYHYRISVSSDDIGTNGVEEDSSRATYL